MALSLAVVLVLALVRVLVLALEQAQALEQVLEPALEPLERLALVLALLEQVPAQQHFDTGRSLPLANTHNKALPVDRAGAERVREQEREAG